MDETLSDPRITGALIGALVVAAGWLVTGLRERMEERRARREREGDVRIALAAEVKAYVAALRDFDPLEQWREITLRMEREPDYVPTVSTERADVVFAALVSEVQVQVLPVAAIDPVVRYYSHLRALEAIVGDLRSPLYRRMGQSERIEMYTDYVSMRLRALELGQAAIAALEADPGVRRP